MAAREPRRPAGVEAVVLDTDGVLTRSAGLHAAAWRIAFDACLRAAGDERPFDTGAEYRRYVDGRSRQDGARALLRSRGVALPEGAADEPPGTGSVAAVCARKDQELRALLAARPVPEMPGAARLLRALRDRGVACAAVSASRHATDLLRGASLLGLLRLVVDGNEARRLGLPGKPDPALFLEATRRLGAAPGRTAVVEDALAGVAAGRRGGFALVVGVNGAGTAEAAEELRQHGADMVVTGPDALLGSAALFGRGSTFAEDSSRDPRDPPPESDPAHGGRSGRDDRHNRGGGRRGGEG